MLIISDELSQSVLLQYKIENLPLKSIKVKHFYESIPSFAVDYDTESWGATSIIKAATQYLFQMKSSVCLRNIEILVDAIDEE